MVMPVTLSTQDGRDSPGRRAAAGLKPSGFDQCTSYAQARWVWLIIVSCSLLLTTAIVAAVAVFAAAAFAVLPRDEFTIAIVPLTVGAICIIVVLIWLAESTLATKPDNILPFLAELRDSSKITQRIRLIYHLLAACWRPVYGPQMQPGGPAAVPPAPEDGTPGQGANAGASQAIAPYQHRNAASTVVSAGDQQAPSCQARPSMLIRTSPHDGAQQVDQASGPGHASQAVDGGGSAQSAPATGSGSASQMLASAGPQPAAPRTQPGDAPHRVAVAGAPLQATGRPGPGMSQTVIGAGSAGQHVPHAATGQQTVPRPRQLMLLRRLSADGGQQSVGASDPGDIPLRSVRRHSSKICQYVSAGWHSSGSAGRP